MAEKQAHWSKSNNSIQLFQPEAFIRLFQIEGLDRYRVGSHWEVSVGADNARKLQIEQSTWKSATLRMILKWARLWATLSPDINMLPERRDIGRALSPEEETRLLEACRHSPKGPSPLSGNRDFLQHRPEEPELRCARWSQVDFLKAEFTVGLSKTEEGTDRIIPLNQTAVQAFKDWRARWPNLRPGDFIFPSEKLRFKGKGAATKGIMTAYDTERSKLAGIWKKGKRPEFPSGMTSGLRTTMSSWLMSWKREVCIVLADTERYRRSVG